MHGHTRLSYIHFYHYFLVFPILGDLGGSMNWPGELLKGLSDSFPWLGRRVVVWEGRPHGEVVFSSYLIKAVSYLETHLDRR